MKVVFLLYTLALLICCITGCGSSSSQTSKNGYNKDFFAMDTHMRITAYGPQSQAAVASVEQEIKRLEELLSAHKKTSELGKLQEKRETKLAPEAVLLIKQAQQLHQETQGAFNITLTPVSKLWGFPHGPYHVPTKEELDAALKTTGMEKIQLDSKSGLCTLSDAGITIDLGGIAKGYAAERAAALLHSKGCTGAVINLGGNVKVIGQKPDGSPYQIGIQHPDKENDYLGILRLENTSIVTSGDYERYFLQQGQRYHHIINPHTGLPADNGLRSITIICPDSTMADGLSTALFVLGPREAISYWRKHKQDFDMLLYTKENKLYLTPNLAPSFSSNLACTTIK